MYYLFSLQKKIKSYYQIQTLKSLQIKKLTGISANEDKYTNQGGKVSSTVSDTVNALCSLLDLQNKFLVTYEEEIIFNFINCAKQTQLGHSKNITLAVIREIFMFDHLASHDPTKIILC